MSNIPSSKNDNTEGAVSEFVTAMIGGQLFGLPISRVQDVFMPERLTRVPLSSGEIAGVLNLRGRIVTVVDMRARLGLPPNEDGKPPMAVGVDLRGESYGLLIDQIGEVLKLADDGRSMGLVVDEIIDIVEERLNIEVAGSREGILGSAVIKGQATEVIDVGHFLPMAFADWFSRKEMRPSVTAQSVLLVDDSAFFRNMLAPVLKAAGYKVRVAPSAEEGLSALRSGQLFDVVLTDIEMPDMNGFEFAETIRADAHLSTMPIIALSSMVSPAAIERGRLAGFHDYVAKFDRPGLIAALKEQTAELNKAA